MNYDPDLKVNQILMEEVLSLKDKVLQENLLWKEPHFTGDGECCEWFGNGKQGEEPSRFMMAFDDERVWSSFVCRPEVHPEGHMFSSNWKMQSHFENYCMYLQMNKWL